MTGFSEFGLGICLQAQSIIVTGDRDQYSTPNVTVLTALSFFCTTSMAATLPPLDYAYDALEPYISQEIMTLHHTKHHQTYINALNAAEQSYAKAQTPKERIALQAALKFNGGG